MKRPQSVFKALLLTAVMLVSPACTSTGGGKVTLWNPMTWFSGSEGRALTAAEGKRDDAADRLLGKAHEAVVETSFALAGASPSTAVDVAKDANEAAAGALDQVLGPLTAEKRAAIKKMVEGLVSENIELRKQAEKTRVESRESLADLSEELRKRDEKLKSLTRDLQEAFVRENELANELRNQRFILWAVGIAAVIGYVGILYLKITYGGIPQAVGRGIFELRKTRPEAADLLTPILDSYLNRNEQKRIRDHAI